MEKKQQMEEQLGDKSGWKLRHESPSPEPEDLTNIEFTPSEIDALDSVPPPTPIMPDYRQFVTDDSCSEGLPIFGPLQRDERAYSIQESQSSGSRGRSGSEAMSEPIYEDPSVPVVNGPSAASAAENRETSIFTRSHRSGGLHDNHGNRHGLQPLPPAEPKVLSSSRPTRPAMRRGRSVEARKKRGTESISPGRTQASRISKSVGNVRRSARIAERAKMKQDSSPPSNTVKATCQMSAKVVQTAVAEAPSSSKIQKGRKQGF